MELTLVLLVVVIALAFEYINGFHDTANSIATVVATKVMTPGQAVMLAAATNLIGALAGHRRRENDCFRLDRHQSRGGDAGRADLRVARRDHLEPDHLVVGFAVEFVACAGRRPVRRRAGRRAEQLGSDHLGAGRHALVGRKRCSAESRAADGHLAGGRIHHRPAADGFPVFAVRMVRLDERAVAEIRSHPFRECVLRQGAACLGQRNGPLTRHERRAKNHGHHRAGAGRRDRVRRPRSHSRRGCISCASARMRTASSTSRSGSRCCAR